MGVVLKQSLSNTLITYAGFAIGALNYLFLYTKFMSAEYFGLIGVILASSGILMPIFAFGVNNTIVKFFSSFKKEKDIDSFLTLMLLLPFSMIIVLGFLTYMYYDRVTEFLSKENEIAGDYIVYIFLIGVSLAYFEIFYAWARVHMKSVFGNFMKEIFVRVGSMILLILLYFKTIDVSFFLKALVGLYIMRMLVMKGYAYFLRIPKLSFDWPQNIRSILNYTTLIILGGSAAVVLLEIDKVMLNQLVELKNVAYYTVAAYMGIAIGVPSRSMQQITTPLTAKLLNENDTVGLKKLYQKSSLTLFIASGFLFLLVVLNVEELYQLIPEAYRGGFTVVCVIGLIKVYDALLGNNTAILYTSDYYKAVLVMGLVLAFFMIVLNLWLIPIYGIEGAAMASFLAFFLFNSIKLFYVQLKFGIIPFTINTLKAFGLLLVVGVPFYFLELNFHPIVNILCKSIAMSLIFITLAFRLKISDDVNGLLVKLFKK